MRGDLVDGGQRSLADGGAAAPGQVDLEIQADPPLIGRAEDDRVLAAPAVRIAVADLPWFSPGVQQGPRRGEQLDDLRVRVEDLHAFEAGNADVAREAPQAVHRRPDGQPMLHADVEVVLAVARRGVDQAGAGLRGRVRAHHHGALPGDQRVAVLPAFELAALQRPLDPFGVPEGGAGGARGGEQIVAPRVGRLRQLLGRGLLQEGVEQVLGDDRDAVPRQIVRDVLQVRIGGDGQVRRDGPGRGGPDGEAPSLRPSRGDRKADVDGGTCPVRVFHLRFGERGDVGEAPVYRPLAAVERAPAGELRQLAHDVRLVAEIHRLVGVVPAGEDPQALEILPLQVDLLLGVLAAGAAELAHAHLPLLRAELLVHLALDGEAVAVPTRHEVGQVAGHEVVLADQVLEDLVEEVALVDGAVGVGRAVVKNELGRAGVLLQQLVVDLLVLPCLDLRRLALAERGAHGKVGLRQVNAISVVHPRPGREKAFA